MDPERRNRVAALLATTDHLPAPVAKELLADHDDAITALHRLQGKLEDAYASQLKTEVRLREVEADANRLAAWIVTHPRPGPEMTAVLDAHDRTLPF